MVEITFEEQNKVKRMKRTEESLRDFWDHIKCTNIQIIGVPEEEEKKKGYEKIFEEIIVENFPNMENEIVKSKRHKDGMGWEAGEGSRMGNTCKSMADSRQCMAKTTTIV